MSDLAKIKCEIDGAMVHSIALHLKNNYAGTEWTTKLYEERFPGAPLLSAYAATQVAARRAQLSEEENKIVAIGGMTTTRKLLHEVFELGEVAAAKNKRGEPIAISVLENHDKSLLPYIPAVDKNYVFHIDLIKTAIIGLELNLPTLFWGYHGTGKTTVVEQVAARTRRPLVRVQHTVNTEEAHVTGQYVVQNGATHFQPGPLVDAMRMGLIYLADEYDFALPSVLSVYQPVLEGKPLLIKDAPPEMRIIKPHPNFRFVATGNTNGGGDETGLYQGTQVQNAANYSRFAITEEVKYMDAKVEATIVASQGGIDIKDAQKLVQFAGEVRNNFAAGRIATTISPRELIRAAQLARVKGSEWRSGLELAFINRMGRTDKEVVNGFAQRVFG